MRFLIVGNFFDFAKTSEFQKLDEAESKALWELYGAGILREALFGKDMSCSSFVFECRNFNEAEQFLKTLPSSKAELIKYRISELAAFPKLTEQFERNNSARPAWL